MKYLICSFLLLFCTSMVAKEVLNDKNLIKSRYDSIVEAKKGFYSIDNLVSLTKTRNSFYLQHFGYYINSNNIMYEKTLDKKYLDLNYKLIANTIYDLNEYKLNAPKNNVNVKHNGEEFILFEGYFFRYVSQYLYILHKDNLLDNYKDGRMFSILLEKRIDLWKARSIRRYNNDYLFKKNIMHIWVLWIHSYVYLDAISGKQKYEANINEFFEAFDQALFENNKKNVVWYSYITKKESIVIKNVIPDISHANHIISFFYDIFKYDLVKTEINQNLFTEVFTTFSNSESFYIDGSIGKEKEEWRLSDGWLKLLDLANASERNNLKAIQEKMIKKHWIDIENSLLYIQFLAVLY